MALISLGLYVAYSSHSDSYSMSLSVRSTDYFVDPVKVTLLKEKQLELLSGDPSDPQPLLRGLLEEGMSPWRFRVRCSDPF